MHLSLRFLGPFRAHLDSETTIESRAKRIEALLAFLAAESDRAHRREKLVGLLFPEMPEERARTNLRQTLTRLRRAIGDQKADPPFLLVSRESTQFNLASDHFLDVLAFKHLLGGCPVHHPERNLNCQSCIEQIGVAIDLYRGPFLEDFFLEDSAAFEEWLLVKREQFQEQALVALQQLADYYERSGAYATAAAFVRHQLRIEPWREKAHRQLMRLLAYQGQRGAALQQYRTLESILWDELGVEPLPETNLLRDRIRTAEDTRPTQLPPLSPSFTGREREMALLHEHLTNPEKRLITLTGSGGTGKTALAVETGWRVSSGYLGPFFHGVFFVPLAGINTEREKRSPDLVEFDPLVTTIAEVIGFSFSGSRQPEEQLFRYLQDKSLLLVLDNAEHVIEHIRSLLRDLLLEASEVKILVTSRERLGLSEEWIIEIVGLPYPDSDQVDTTASDQLPDLEDLSAQYQAIALFESLGKHLLPGFGLSAQNGAQGNCPVIAVQRIAQLVQGLPLGIELAASWLRMLSCEEIAAEIENSLDFLSSTMHDLPPRHQSLRAVFNSSWQLLNEEEQRILRRLSVFQGPFDRQAATSITDSSILTLGSLVDRSLVRRQDASELNTVRFELLEVLRQFAAEKLEETSDEGSQVQERHTAYYLNFLSMQRDALQGSDQGASVARVSQNIGEIRAAWQKAIRNHDFQALSGALEPLGLFYYMRSWFAEGAELFQQATQELELSRDDPNLNVIWARLRARQGWFSFLLGKQQEGRAQLIESVEVLREDGDPTDLAYSLSFSAAALTMLGDYKHARHLVEEALAINKKCQDAYGCAIANNVLSQICYQQGDFSAAKQYSEESLAIERSIGNRWSVGFSLTNLGRVAFALGNYDDAQGYFQESRAIRRELEDKRGQALCLRYSGDAALAKGDKDRAHQEYEASLALFRSLGGQDETSATLNRLGFLALQRQERPAAQRIFAEGLSVARQAASTPRILEAAIGLATLLAVNDPRESARIATFVRNHEAANRNSREQAGLLLEEFHDKYGSVLDEKDRQRIQALDLDQLLEDFSSAFMWRETH